jgi:hypothetical protein
MHAIGIALIAIGLALFSLSIILDRRSSSPEERVEREEHRE